MSKLLRYYRPGAIYFVTSVTHNRAPILINHFDELWGAITSVCEKDKIKIIAWVILPDHFHMILDPAETNLSSVMKRVKLRFSYAYRARKGLYRGTVWQNRFWDHIIRNQEDMNNHIDYIHYNPVKHNYVKNPFDWNYSSLGEYYKRDCYSRDWGVMDEVRFEDDYGE